MLGLSRCTRRLADRVMYLSSALEAFRFLDPEAQK